MVKITEYYSEPVLNDSQPKWLHIVKKEEQPFDENKKIEDVLKNPEPFEIITTFETKEPNIWYCKKCGGMFRSDETPTECQQCNRSSNFKRITEDIDPNLWKLPIWEDIPTENLDVINTYVDILNLSKRCVIFPEEIHYKIISLWIISTWKQDCWNTVPFLIFRGLVESGKTRALEFIKELGYRTIHASGITQKAMFRFGDVHNANILIDEIDNKIDHRTESGREMIDYLKPSYKKGSYYYAADKENPKKVHKYKNYGFKAFAGEKGGFDQAIFSRSIDFQMEQDYPEITELYTIENELNRIRTILLNYRYKTNNPPELPHDFPLRGRNREIYGCLVRTAIHIGESYDDIIEFVKSTQIEKQEELENSDEFQVLKVIHDYECQPTLDDAPNAISYSEIADALGWEDKQRQKIGYIFKKKLILKTKRRNSGSVVLLGDQKNARKLKSLYRRFKLT